MSENIVRDTPNLDNSKKMDSWFMGNYNQAT